MTNTLWDLLIYIVIIFGSVSLMAVIEIVLLVKFEIDEKIKNLIARLRRKK